MYDFVLEQLTYFLNSERCCKQFSETFRLKERQWFSELAVRNGLKARPFIYKGQKVLKLYKPKCIHYIENPYEIDLDNNSQKYLYLLHSEGNFVNSLSEMQMSPDFLGYGGQKPSIPIHRFSLGPLKQCMAKFNVKLQNTTNCKILPFKQPILESIKRSRVMVINGDRSFDKSAVLPMFLIENCAKRKLHCKIVCVEKEEVFAIYNSERLAEQLSEKIGETIAYQLHLQSRISEASNLIYTTASYFLRVLMGESPVNSFRHISHVIVNDIQQHDAYTDILLSELRTALQMHAHLKIILLSNAASSSEFLTYFGEGEEFFLTERKHKERCGPKVFYMEDIRTMLNKRRNFPNLTFYMPPSLNPEIDTNIPHLNRSMEIYQQYGSEEAFNSLLYMYRGEYASINQRLPQNGSTAIIIATKLGNAKHVEVLLELNADPYLLDNENRNAYCYAEEKNRNDIIELLRKHCNPLYAPKDCVPAVLDYDLINNLLHLILTGQEWPVGNILVFVPTYTQLLSLNFSILRHQLIGNLPQEVSIKLLYSKIDKDKLRDFLKYSYRVGVNIILSTDIADTVTFIKNITYVIDLSRAERVVYNVDKLCNEKKFEWISKETFDGRMQFAGNGNAQGGICFRLLPKVIYDTLPLKHIPELLTMPLDRICLTVKLISPHTMIAEYLQRTIVAPPFLHIHNTVGLLKKIEVFDDLEDITWLSCRLIDVPVPCQLGKLLVMGILLQCIDPILTIVSFKLNEDPLEMPTDIAQFVMPFAYSMRKSLRSERNRYAEGKQSDHLLYLRLYSEWQNNQREDCPQMTLNDEYQFVFNGIMEKIYELRTQLVGNLRAAQLIHTQGPLSMHYINLKSNSWPVIKAALVAGLYPNICYIDRMAGRLKSNRCRELMIHPNSILRNLELEPLSNLVRNFKSYWLLYGQETNSVTCNSINCCTLILPVAIALFAGPTKLHPLNIHEKLNTSNTAAESFYFVDELICLQMNSVNAQLIFKTRQYFYSAYHNYLQNCCQLEKWRRQCHTKSLFDTIEKVLLSEDISKGLHQPEHVGLRPKAAPNKFLSHFHDFIAWERNWNNDSKDLQVNAAAAAPSATMNTSASCTSLIPMSVATSSPPTVTYASSHTTISTNSQYFTNIHFVNKGIGLKPKAFYLVCITDDNLSSAGNGGITDSMQVSLSEAIDPVVTTEKLTYVIMYSKLPDQLRLISMAKWNCGEFRLYECFRNRIPIYDLVDTCLNKMIHLPNFNSHQQAYPLEERIGNIILELFAYRVNMLHNN